MGLEDMAFTTGARALGLRIKDGEVIHKTGHGPIAGARASIETSGDIERRITATRLLAVGVFALAFRKKQDHRSLWLTIEGPEFQILVEVRPDHEAATRRWVTRFNNRALGAAS